VLAVRPDATLYADLPYALHPSLGFTLPSDVSPAGRLPRPVRLDEARAAEKVEAASCYESQLAQLVEGFGPFLTPEKLGRELLWESLRA
jgi:hypothetical protein